MEDGSVTATAAAGILANDVDPDAGDVLRVVGIRNSAELKTVADSGTTTLSDAYGTLTLAADGSYSFLADGIASQALAVGQSAQTQYTVTVSDGLINRESTLSFSIQGTNDAPRVVPPLTNLADGVEGAPYLISSNALLADVADPDIGDPLSIRNLSVSSGNLTTSTNGAWVLTVQSSTQVNLGTGQEDTPLLFSVDQLLGGSSDSIDVRISYVVEDPNGGLLPVERMARFIRANSLAGADVTQLTVLGGGGVASRHQAR